MALDNPPNYGQRLIPQILDRLASTAPDTIVYSIAKISETSFELEHITARAFAKAVDKTAWWLSNQLQDEQHKEHLNGTQNADQNGRLQEPSKIKPLAYIGPHDIRHALLTFGAVKANCAALFLSPKNNVEGALAVLNVADCSIWVKPHEQPELSLLQEVQQKKSIRVLELPGVDELLDAESTPPYPFDKTWESAVNEPFCILHTSGTTGVPKPISWTHGLVGTMDAIRLLPPTEGDGGLAPWSNNWNEGDKIYSSFPMSHGAGIIMDVIIPSLFRMQCILSPSGVLPNIGLIKTLAENAGIDVWSMVPSLADELGEAPGVLAKFKSSKFICVSGGPVSPSIVTKVNKVVRVLNLTGTTEGLFIGNLWVEREDWHWFSFHPYSGFEFKEIEPGVFEHWVHRHENWAKFQGVFYTFPDQQSVNLKDLYIKHPTKPNLWAFKGRTDDVVVLSNGFKISPLEVEALVTTHPSVESCLLIGTGKPQAGLLIKLNEGVTKNVELFDSIWETVDRANNTTFQKSRLHREYIAFAEPDKPFILTDKKTVKRRATLEIYADFIDHFYMTRDEDAGSEDFSAFTVDTTSIETITQSVSSILGTMLPEIEEESPDEDFFALGLDSLFVFRAVAIIRAATGLQEQLAPRHLYANPTVASFSVQLAKLLEEAKETEAALTESTNGSTPGTPVDRALAKDDPTNLQKKIADRARRVGFKMNPFDAVNPNHYLGLDFYFPLSTGISFQDAFAKLQAGLRRTFEFLPELDGKMIFASEHEIGYKKGEYRITVPPQPLPASSEPRQLVYKDLSKVLPSFETMRETDFAPSLYRDELVLDCYPFPAMPADILVVQANFVEGGCILGTNFIHTCMDGIGVLIALKLWAECCRYLDGDQTATCDWFDPESFNHSLPEILHEQEGWSKSADEVDPGVWGFLPFFNPDESAGNLTGPQTNGNHVNGGSNKAPKFGSLKNALAPAPVFPPQPTWPAAPNKRSLSTVVFQIPAARIQMLKQEVIVDPEAKGLITSVSDIVQAFFWRASIRSRYRVATEIRGETFGPEDLSILELPIDGRPYFSSSLPASYMGSMLVLNRAVMDIESLCSPNTSIGKIAYVLRQAASRIKPSLVHDAFTLLQSMSDYSKPATANMGLDHMNAMISNLMLFQTDDLSFGDGLFAGGRPEAMRPQIERGHRRFRFLVISPQRKDGGVELVLGILPEELEMLQSDPEFTKYAKLVDSL